MLKVSNIKSKSALLHTDNYEENKNLIGQTLSAYLDDYENIDPMIEGRSFKKIAKDIFAKNKSTLLNSISMMIPFLIFIMVPFIINWCTSLFVNSKLVL